MGNWREWWSRYRHFRAAQGLIQDVLGLFGWKQAFGAAVTGAITYVGSIRLQPVEAWVLSLAAFACALLIFNLAPVAVAKLRRGHRNSGDRLEYAGWINGGRISAQNRCGGEASFIEVVNMATAIPRAAEDVRAELAFDSDSGTHFVVSNAAWWEAHRQNTAHTVSWSSRIARMEGGESQYLVLWIAKEKDGRLEVSDENCWPINTIEFGHWRVTIRVTSNNFDGFEGIMGFTYGPDCLRRDRQRAVIMRRRLPPRFQPS